LTIPVRRTLFDTTVLWGAFHVPTGPNAKLLDLAAQRSPVLDGFITDAVGAEFWWRATQQGVKGPGQPVARTYTQAELEPFFEAYGVLFEPDSVAQAPLGRSLGRYSGLVGLSLGEVLHIITGKDRDELLAAATLAFPMNFETVDIADLHVITGALDNGADEICSNDKTTLSYDPIGSLRVRRPVDLAMELCLIDMSESAARVRE
jgi:hypothetical protein